MQRALRRVDCCESIVAPQRNHPHTKAHEQKETTNLGPGKNSFGFDKGKRPPESSHLGAPGFCLVGVIPWWQEAHREAQGEHDEGEEAQARRNHARGPQTAVVGDEEAVGRAQEAGKMKRK